MEYKTREEVPIKYKWDLEKMFFNKKEYEASFLEIDKLLDKVESYKGKIMSSSDTLYNFYQDYEKMDRLVSKVIIYARLLCDTDTTNNEYQEDIVEYLEYLNRECLNYQMGVCLAPCTKRCNEYDQRQNAAA